MTPDEEAEIQKQAEKLRANTHICIQRTAATKLVLAQVRANPVAAPEEIAKSASEWREAEAALKSAVDAEVEFYAKNATVIEQQDTAASQMEKWVEEWHTSRSEKTIWEYMGVSRADYVAWVEQRITSEDLIKRISRSG